MHIEINNLVVREEIKEGRSVIDNTSREAMIDDPLIKSLAHKLST